ncbi:MAG TPA: hypothetical protein VF588_17745 [Pyrinomonadaceae bacterium]|jgi:hypothetical protein
MKRSLSSAFVTVLLFACFLVAHGGAARAQEAWPSAGGGLLAGTTRKFDEYGKVGHCDETARLDNFAIELQNEAGLKAYLLVYMGRNDMPSWKEGIVVRAADYLVTSRGLDASRVKAVFGGYREERMTELWLVVGDDPAPEPSDTIDVKIDRTKAFQWDEMSVEVEFSYDVGEESEESEDEEGAEAEDESEEADDEAAPKAGAESAAGAAGEKQPEAESAEEAEWRKEIEKYEIAVERRGVLEEEEPAVIEVEPQAAATAGEKVAAGQAEEAAPEQEEPPVMGNVKVSLWWDARSFAEALKAEPDSRACLVYYYGLKNADRETVRGLLARAVAKLEEQFGVKGDRVITVEGGYSPDPAVELWVVPRGAEVPKPKLNKRRNIKFYSAPGE